MSNLSELLPTGGGQNSVEFTAAENISSGQAVALKTDGQIEAADSANLANVIGLAAEAITSGNTGAVNVFGGINEAQSGLTIGSDYYINSSGSLTTSNTKPYVAIGQAISATTLNLRDNSDNYVPPDPVAFDYLVIAGGGSGGSNRGGGGGAGGYLSGADTASYRPDSSFTVTIGAGGSGYSGTGSDSVFGSITSAGGGYGGNFDQAGQAGGSGSGAGGGNAVRSGGTATPSGQGNDGGSNSYAGGGYPAGAGGGAGAVGQSSQGAAVSGSGGNGLSWSVDSTTRAGGGGGGGGYTTSSGGTGGGGAGTNLGFTAGTSGTSNTGGGGGGGGSDGSNSNGGSGIIILRTPDTAADLTIPGTLTYTKTTPTGYKLYTFTAGTGTVTV